MTEKDRILFGIVAGAVMGGVAGFFLFTERGRRARAEVEPYLAELAKDVSHLQELVSRVRDTANDGWRQVESLVGDRRTSPTSDVRRH